jgi:hypothetical protein
MSKIMALISFSLLLPLFAQAQQGSAEPGYYPMGFNGDTWTGVVSSTNDETREITLTYTKHDKTQTFVGVLKEGYMLKLKDGTPHAVKVSEIPMGMRLKVYYMPRERKVDGRKVRYNEIFQFLRIKDL